MTVTAAEIRAVLTLQDQMSAQLSKVKGELSALSTAVQQSGGAARNSGPSWISMASAMAAGQLAAHGLMAAAQKLQQTFMQNLDAVSDFGQSIADTAAKMSPADMDQYGEALARNAIRLGKDYPLSATEAQKAQDILISKGIAAQKVLDGGAEAVVRLSTATGGDLAQSAEVTAAVMDLFQVSTDELEGSVNLLAGAMNLGGVSINDLNYVMKAGGGVMAMHGASLRDAAIATAAMAKAGYEGADAGTSLKSLYNSLQPTTKAATAAMLELGLVTKDGRVAFYDAEGNIKSYNEIAQLLYDSTKDLTAQQRALAFETIFGSDGMRAAAASYNFAKNGVEEFSEALDNMDATEASKKRMDTLQGSMGQFGGSMETITLILMTQFVPGLRTVIDTGTELLNNVIDKLDPETINAFATSAKESFAQMGQALSDTAVDVGLLARRLEEMGPVGKIVAAGLRPLSDILSGIASLMSGDSKAAAESFRQALTDVKGSADSLIGMLSKAAEEFGKLNAKAADRGAFDGYSRAMSEILTSANNLVGSFGKLAESLGRLSTAFGIGNDEITAYEKGIRLIASAFIISVSMTEVFVDTTFQMIRVIADVVSALVGMGRAFALLAQGDIPGFMAAGDQAVDSMKDIIQTGEDWANNTHGAVSRAWRAISQTTIAETAVSTRAVQAGMDAANLAVAEGSAGMLREMEANTTSISQVNEETWTYISEQAGVGMANAAAAVEEQAPAMAAAATTGAQAAADAVDGFAGMAEAAGSNVGSSIGDGMESGIMATIGRVANAAREMVMQAIGAGKAEAEIHSPSKKTEKDGEMIVDGYIKGIDNLAPELQAAMHQLLDDALAYQPKASQIKAVEKEISDIRERAQTEALFREKEMVTINSESLRLKRDIAYAERDLIPVKRQQADLTREINNLERGSLADRQKNIQLDGDRKKIALDILDLEEKLANVKKDGKEAKAIQEEIDKLRDKDQAIGREMERQRLLGEIAATGHKIRKEALDEQISNQELAIQAIKNQIDVLGGEQAIFSANEAVIKNATDNEIKYREQLIAVFKSESKPLLDRIDAGLALIEQLEAEGKISKELADALREVANKARDGKGAATDLGNAAQNATPQLDAAAKKAEEMAKAAGKIGKEADDAADDVDSLAKSLGKLPSWFTPKNAGDALGFVKGKAIGGDIFAGESVLVGEQGPEVVRFGRAGTVLSHDATRQAYYGSVMGDGGGYSTGSASTGRTERLEIDLMIGDEVAERIYITGKELSARRRTDD